MSLSKHKKIPTYDFPEEILSEVFKRLLVKHVLRCGAVQKSWYYLIKSSMFISLHSNHQNMSAHNNPKYLLFHDTDTHDLTVRSDDAQCRKYCTFNYPFGLPFSSWYAQSNGLICVSAVFDPIYDYSPNIYLWIPLVQKFKTVPDSPLSTFTFEETKWNALAFGFLPEVKDYVVVHIVKPRFVPNSVMIGVYSVNTNSWKKICQDKGFVDFMETNESVFVNGTAFWVGCSSDELYQFIMYFDTKTNILQKIMVPNWIVIYEHRLKNKNPSILPYGQSIAYFVEVEDFDAHEDDEELRIGLLIWTFGYSKRI